MIRFKTQVFIFISLAIVTILTVIIYNIFFKILSSKENDVIGDNTSGNQKNTVNEENAQKEFEQDTAGKVVEKPGRKKKHDPVRTPIGIAPIMPPDTNRISKEEEPAEKEHTENSSSNSAKFFTHNENPLKEPVQYTADKAFEKPVQKQSARKPIDITPVTPPSAARVSREERPVTTEPSLSANRTTDADSSTSTRTFTLDKEAFPGKEEAPFKRRSPINQTPVMPGRKD